MLKIILLILSLSALAACSKLEKQESFKELAYDYFGSYEKKKLACKSENLKNENSTCGNIYRIMRASSTGGLSSCFDYKNRTVNHACVDALAEKKEYE